MPDLTDKISLKSAAGIVGALAVLIGAVISIESRYAHAGEVKSSYSRLEMQVNLISMQNRSWLLSDRIASIEIKPESQRTDFDRVQLNRYRQELNDTNSTIRRLESDMRSIK